MEQLEHIMLGNRIYIWLHDGGTGMIYSMFLEKKEIGSGFVMMYENCLFEMKSCFSLLVVMCYDNPAHILSMVSVFCELSIIHWENGLW